MISNSTEFGKVPFQKGPSLWDYKGYSLIADRHPPAQQLSLVDHLDRLHGEAKSKIAHIHHFDDANAVCQKLEIVCIEPEPSYADKWTWLAGWRGVPVSFGVVPNFAL